MLNERGIHLSNEIKNTLKSITTFSFIILMFILNAGFVINERYVTVAVSGFLIGIFNLYLRAIMLNRLTVNNSSKCTSFYLAGYVIRVGLTAIIGALLFTVDKYYIFAYMGGYILHFLGIILHGFKLLILERKL